MADHVEEEAIVADDRRTRDASLAPRHGLAGGLHRWLGGFPTAFFTLALITDYAYLQTAELQWQYFSIWLITAALIMGGLAVLAGIVDWATGGARGRRGVVWHFGLTVLALIVGLINAFIHSRDGWVAVVPQGILLSLLTVILLYGGALVAGLLDRPRTADREARA
ncbi:MAG: DUF2231 domain-containing protein [Sphingomicrobium sp.]|nr:DUF2231 domain-containing protein [Sphingomonadales bacterium]